MQKPQLTGSYNVETTVSINASQQKVWEILGDFTNVAWAPGVKASHAIGKSELGIGAGRHCTLDGFGEIDEYITQWHEGTGFVYNVSALGPLNNAHSRWWLTKTGANTCSLNIVISYDIRFSVLGMLLHTLIMRKKLEQSLPQTAIAVKEQAETRHKDKSSVNAEHTSNGDHVVGVQS